MMGLKMWFKEERRERGLSSFIFAKLPDIFVLQQENANLYGHHPFFMNIDDDGNAFGVYFHNSNAMGM